MRIYARDKACGFRYSNAAWGAFSNFQPLAVPIAAGPWSFFSSEALYQAGKFTAHPDVQQRIAAVATAREDENGKPLVFRDTMIANIRNLVDIVPRLNIFADELMEKFAGYFVPPPEPARKAA